MTSAVYGRMALGRCVEQDYGNLGCHNDALGILDKECSGRNECGFLVTSQKLWKNEQTSCIKAMIGYVEATYSCISGKKYKNKNN